MANMDQLVDQQKVNSKILQQIIDNYKKDPKERKTLAYYEERLRRLDEAWDRFEETDNAVRTLSDVPMQHPYFVKEFYTTNSEVYRQYRDHFSNQIESLRSGVTAKPIKNPESLQNSATTQSESARRQDDNTTSAIKPHQNLGSKDDNIKALTDPTMFETKSRTEEENMESHEICRIIRRQKAVIQSLHRLLSGLQLQEHHSKQYYEFKIKTINSYWSQIEDHNYSIWELIEDPSQTSYDIEAYMQLEEKVQQSLIQLSKKLDESSASSIQPLTDTATMLKLPQITLPKFDGDYLKWRQFCDLFTEMVHKQAVANCQKMWYLKMNLTGEAEKLIRHFPLSDENYTTAWKMLQDRYDNPRLLVAALVNKLLSQPSHASENVSATAIKALHDTTQECLLGLENLGITTSNWDPILLHVLLRKLDRITHTLYEQSLSNPRSLQTIKGFLEFLETRFQSLEALGNKEKMLGDKQKKYNIAKSLTSITTPDSSCVSCKGNHQLFACKSFLKLMPNARMKLLRRHNLCINCLKAGHNAANCTSRGCIKCNKKHNTLVHLQGTENSERIEGSSTNRQCNSITSSATLSASDKTNEQSLTLATLGNQSLRSYVLLSTARVRLVNNSGQGIECRAILDSGSQVNLITERLTKKLGLTSVHESMIIQGIGHGRQQTQQRVNVLLQSRLNGFSARLEAFVLPNIILPQPTQTLDTSTWAIPQNVNLADPTFNRPDRIDLLLGAEFYHQLLAIGQIKLGNDLPILQNTVFGWIVAGKINRIPMITATCGICSEDEGLDQKIEKFWKLEEAEEVKKHFTATERRCETHFNQTARRNANGRFVVSLPFAGEPRNLGESKDIALRRFLALERRLARHSDIKQQYVEFMNEYIRLGHMEEIDNRIIQSPYYFLPHHCVLKPDSSTTKLRVVFDASAKTSSNISLNNLLLAGPVIQDDLFSILLRFRMPRYVFTADIQKMYRQILLQEDDKRYHLIVWRNDPRETLKYYRLCTVTYGTTSAPYLATKCLQRLAQEGASKYPLGSHVLQHDFYVDDVMTGSNSLIETAETQTQLANLLQEAGFKLRKWCANHPKLLQNILPEDQEVQLDFTDEREEQIKTLGLIWLPKSDQFCIKTNWTTEHKVTKRAVTSDIARLFDPLGIMAPVIVTAKIFLQQLWQLKIDWDAALPMELHSNWLRFRNNLHTLNNIQFPRHVFAHEKPRSMQIHAFADASEKAYGAALYVRSINDDGRIMVRLLCAKSRVAPTKKISLPRLELCAAKLAAELTNRIKTNLKLENTITYYWTDSEIVLAWINSTASSFHTFVANRVSAIQELSIVQQWRHVTSKENPADVLSRGISPEKIESCTLWFYGPPFLHGKESIWPPSYIKSNQGDLEKKRTAISLSTTRSNENATSIIYRINHRNSFRKLQRITAYVLRFINNTRKSNSPLNRTRYHTIQELDQALYAIIKTMQQDEFKEDIRQLRQYKEPSKNSPLNSLAPFLDDRGILRVGGRLQASNLAYNSKHPMLLPYSHLFTKLLMADIHRENLHVGPQGLLAITRHRFWPIKGKTIARSIVQHCVRCAKTRPKMYSQMMGNLPADRIQPARPFVNSGVDFCGPIWIHYRTKGKRPQKSYVAVFCCFATKAVHLEVVSDLSTDAFIGAMKRFIGRRGHCKHLYCDNATNFVGARNQLEELNQNIYSKQSQELIASTCSEKGIEFRFIPPRAPHFGGLWEAAVKSAKHLLQRSVASASLTYEELETVMIEIEAILNSRPLTPMSSDPNDLTALTPGHFLIGEPLTATIDANSEPLRASLLTRWKLVSHIKREFWQRWSQEYLHELQHRLKWKQHCQNAQPGTIVVIKEDNMPTMKWPLGRIVQTYKGDDGYVRVADVRTASGILRRPIHKLAPLPCEEEASQQGPSCSSDEEDTDQTSKRQSNRLSKRSLNDSEITKRVNANTSTSQTSERDTESPRKRKRSSYGSSLLACLLTCMVLPIIKGNPVQINQFNPHPGIHFENLGTASLVSTEWNLVVYYDLEPYWMEFTAFINGTHTLQHLCNQTKLKSSCIQIIAQFQHLQEELKQDNELFASKTRMKRGALNIIGNVANSLFGVLDSQYAEEMSRTIEKIKENEDHQLILLKNQTSIIDSTINIIKKDQAATQQKFRALDEQFTQLINRINNAGEESYQYKLHRIFTSLSIQMTLIASNLQRIQSSIIDVITDTHHGTISPLLLSPSQLRREIITIKNHLSPSLRLPADHDDMLQLYKLMTAEGQIVNNHVIFKLHLPLVNLQKFDLFKVFPIPVLANDTFIAITPFSNFLAISPHRDYYYPLTEEELSSCVKIQDGNHLCKQRHPVYRRGASISACEVNLLNNMPIAGECRMRKVENSPIWIQLYHSNQWIYAVKERTSINIVCGDEAFPMILEGSGLLKIQQDCTIKHDLITIQGQHIYPSSTRSSYTKLGGLSEIVTPEQLAPILQESTHYQPHTKELNALLEQIAAQNFDLPNKIHEGYIQHMIAGYMGLSLTIIIIIALGWKYSSKTCKRNPPKPTPRPRQSTNKDFMVNLDE